VLVVVGSEGGGLVGGVVMVGCGMEVMVWRL
jgi:hypothetical protein